jgi:hypothetical protein
VILGFSALGSGVTCCVIAGMAAGTGAGVGAGAGVTSIGVDGLALFGSAFGLADAGGTGGNFLSNDSCGTYLYKSGSLPFSCSN